MTSLKVTTDQGRTVECAPDETVTIGRSVDSRVVVDGPGVSREHARLSWTESGWQLTDCSSHGIFVDSRRVSDLLVERPVRIRLGSPGGPLLTVAPEGQDTGPPGAPTSGAETAPPKQRPAVLTRASGADVWNAFNLLLPIRAWVHDRELARGLRAFFFVFALAPLVFFHLFSDATSINTVAWAYTLYFAPIWALVFWYLIRPGKINYVLAGVIALFTAIIGVPLAQQLEKEIAGNGLFLNIVGVGLPEELAKALPVALFMMIFAGSRRYSPRMCMYMGAISGLALGVVESVSYSALYANQGNVLASSLVLSVVYRLVTDSMEHACWAAISGYFIGLAIANRRRRVQLAVAGVLLASVLHGFYDTYASNWGGVAVMAISFFIFLGYVTTADQIQRRVHRTPIFRGESILLDEPSESRSRPKSTS